MRQFTTGRRLTALSVALTWGLGAFGANAQGVPPGCSAQGNAGGAVTGALLGGVAGALLGNAVSGRHKAGGTVIGGVTGAAAGAMIGGSQPCPQGYVYNATPVMSEDPPPRLVRDDDFWRGSPPSVHERIVFMHRRIDRLSANGWLSPRETDGLLHRLGDISAHDQRGRELNGGVLPPEVRDHLEADLNGVARNLRWKEYRTQHAEE